MKNLIDRIFSRTSIKNKKYVIEEIAPNIVEKNIDPNLPKFMDIDLPAIQKRNENAKWQAPFDNSPTGEDWGKTKPDKNKLPPIIVKINLPKFDHPDLHFMGNSKLDGFPIFRFIGDDPTILKKYPYEEIHTLKFSVEPKLPKFKTLNE